MPSFRRYDLLRAFPSPSRKLSRPSNSTWAGRAWPTARRGGTTGPVITGRAPLKSPTATTWGIGIPTSNYVIQARSGFIGQWRNEAELEQERTETTELFTCLSEFQNRSDDN